MEVDQETISAVLDTELEHTLSRLGLLRRFKHSELRCAFCKDIITWENLHAFYGDSGAVKVSCSKVECIKALSDRLGELKERS